jgi:tetratricopeptide (TPR) repeat protein
VSLLEGEDSKASHDAFELLHTLSSLAASNVPLSIFEEAWSGICAVPQNDNANGLDGISAWHVSRLPKFLDSSASEWDSHRLVEARNTLEMLALLTSSGSGVDCKLSIHPMLHDWIWRRQTTQQMEASWTMAGSAITLACHSNRAWSKHGNEYRSHLGVYVTTRQKYKLFPSPEMPVLQTLYCCAKLLDGVRSDRMALFCLDEISRTLGSWEKSEVSGWLSFIWARSLGRDPGGTKALATQPLVFKKLWARCRLRNGDTTGSITLWEEVMCLEDSLTEDHPDRLASQHELAMAYQANGQVKRAVALLEHVVKAREGSLTEDHPDRLASQHALAIAYQADGQVKRAVALLEHVVKVKEGSLTEDHPSLLASQHVLAGAYRADGQVKRAVALLEHVVKVKEGSLTEDHPSLLASQHVLAGAYRADGQVKRAVALLEHVVKVKEGSLREDHPSRLASQRLLFYMYGMNGQAVLV